MIAADSSTLIAYIEGERGADVDKLHVNLAAGEVGIAPAVLAEVLAEPRLPKRHSDLVLALPVLDLKEGYWLRVAAARARLIARKLKAPLADAMVAQCCVDHGIALVARDRDFKRFAEHCGLTLA